MGCAILALGIYVLVDPSVKQLKNIANTDLLQKNGINLDYIDKCGIAFCVFGGFMFLISFLGCCGALKKVRCLLGLYSTILLLILLAEIAIGIFAAVYSSKLREVLTNVLRQSIRDQYMGEMKNKTIASVAWDAVMYNVSSIVFFKSNIYFKFFSLIVVVFKIIQILIKIKMCGLIVTVQ